ncbi:hypothetical protein ABLG96_14415 [Nakamurella sp. A5-74]|uniref:Uncharacterized protein n=1 Tax=Nakamurella sp. A5-74 TaxID=3158264 RepID=A0AAU8DK09_9ACTN
MTSRFAVPDLPSRADASRTTQAAEPDGTLDGAVMRAYCIEQVFDNDAARLTHRTTFRGAGAR